MPFGSECFAALEGAACDLPEVCDGVSAVCSSESGDAVRDGSVECRPANPDALGCDVAEYCDGTSKHCGADLSAADGAFCDDGNACTALDVCVRRRCKGNFICECSSDAECFDNDACTTDVCVFESGSSGGRT